MVHSGLKLQFLQSIKLCVHTHQYASLSVALIVFCMFCLRFYVPINSCGHVKILGKLDKAVNQYFVHILLLVTDLNQLKAEIVHKKLFRNQSPGKYGMGLGSNSRPLDLQSDSLLTALWGPLSADCHLISERKGDLQN